MSKIKDDINKNMRYVYLVASIALFGLGGFIAVLGNNARNPLLILLGFGALAGGFMMFLAYRRQGSIRLLGDKAKAGVQAIANSLNIYPDRIAFEQMLDKDLLGQPRKCFNDGNFYHVHLYDQTLGRLIEHKLPDDDEQKRYYDPREFANPVTMPSNKKYFTWSASTMQKISVGIMGFIIAGMIIGLIAIN